MSLWIATVALIFTPKGGCSGRSSLGRQGSAMGWRGGLEPPVTLFNIFQILFSCLENKNSVYLCPALQNVPSVLR